MTAPTLQAEGALNVVTSASNTPTVPTHQADDILLLAVGYWAPNTTLTTALINTPTGWTRMTAGSAILGLGDELDADSELDWLRASGPGTTVTVTTTDVDTGNDTAFGARVYVIRGCETNGNPFDDAQVSSTTMYTTANQAVPALTVSGPERLAIHFLIKTDDFVTAPTVPGWTAGAQVESTTGTDHSQGSFRKDNVSSNTSADSSTVEAPAAGGYAFFGVSFKPPAAYVPYRNPIYQLLPH